MLDPEFNEPAEIDERESASLLSPSFTLSLGSETTGGDEDAHVLIAEHSHERTKSVDRGLRVRLTLHLTLIRGEVVPSGSP